MRQFVVAQEEGKAVFGVGPWGAAPVDLEQATQLLNEMKAQGLEPVIYRLVKVEQEKEGKKWI